MSAYSRVFLRKSRQFLPLLSLAFGLSSCTLQGQIEDISQAEISFTSPGADSYSNDTDYNFKIQINSTNRDLTSDRAILQIFENTNCDPSGMVSTSSMTSKNGTAQASSTSSLKDGKKYSARVQIQFKEKTFQSVCSPWVGIDTQDPNPVGVTYPSGNAVNAMKEVLAAWSSTTDNGISGLAKVPYRLRLYGRPLCAGLVLQKIDAVEQRHKFKHLTHGVQYSVQVSALDRADNESPLSCSPYTEIDVHVPGFTLVDSTSSDGYTRVTSPQVRLQNDSQAAYWCFTTDTNFVPTTYTDPCPGGGGTSGGWYTSRPSTLPIGSGDGLKNFNFWIVRSDGTLISLHPASGAITLDQTPPGSFAVTGVGGLSDPIFDGWLTSPGQPRVQWGASTDAVDHTVDIRTTGGALVCSMSEVTTTDLTFVGCPVLTNGQTYKVGITAFDVARNLTQAPNFNFTVDLDPPDSFSITGITGSGDTKIDAFTGAGSPTVNYDSATGSTHYKIHIDDTNGVNVCSVGLKADQSGAFNYAVEAGVTCAGLVHGGTYKAYVSAFDDGENETQASNNGFAFQVDTVAPNLSLETVPASPTSNTFANFVFSTSDDLSGIDRVQCQLDGGAYANCVSPYNLTSLIEGNHTLNVKDFDVAGNVTTKTHSWLIDLTNPVLVIDSQPAAYTNNPNISISFHATDASGIAGYTCKLDGGAANACASPLNFATSEGPHTVIVRATDNVGFYDEKTVNFIVDTTNPVLTLTSVPVNPSHSVTSGTITFDMTDTNPVSATCQIDGGSFVACTSPHTFTGLGSGPHTAVIKATDAAGNVSTQSTLWVIYNYTWITGSFGSCSATQPNWSVGGWDTCSVGQPAYTYSGWGACSATCGGGWQYRTQSCNQVNGNETRSVSCPIANGTQTRTVQCHRNDGIVVVDTLCDGPSQPATSQACTRGGGSDCIGAAPVNSQTCSRGGGSDCYGAQATSQTCNTQPCGGTWSAAAASGGCANGVAGSYQSGACSPIGATNYYWFPGGGSCGGIGMSTVFKQTCQ